MSEDEARRSQQDEQSDDVEAHRRHAAATDEPTAEGAGGDDDFEAHRRHAAANGEAQGEGESDDDFEAHRRHAAAPKKA